MCTFKSEMLSISAIQGGPSGRGQPFLEIVLHCVAEHLIFVNSVPGPDGPSSSCALCVVVRVPLKGTMWGSSFNGD